MLVHLFAKHGIMAKEVLIILQGTQDMSAPTAVILECLNGLLQAQIDCCLDIQHWQGKLVFSVQSATGKG